MATSQTTSVRFHRIGAELRRCREDKNLTLEVASRMLGRSASSLSKIETGTRIIRPRDLEYILMKYGFDRRSAEALLELSRQGTRRGWWHRYTGELSPMAMDFISLEADATSIRTYQMALIPGLLQTEGYARALVEAGHTSGAAHCGRAVQIRLKRQEILNVADPPGYLALLSEAALHHQVGEPQVMHRQLSRLLELPESGSTIVRVLPYDSTATSRLDGSFTIIEIGHDRALIVAMAEALGQVVYQDEPEDVRRQSQLFEYLTAAALPPTDSRALIERVRLKFGGS